MRAIVLVCLCACSFEHGALVAGKEWWDPLYSARRQITVTANVPTPAGYSVAFDADTLTLSLAGRVRADARDWRIVRRTAGGWQELDRWIDDGAGPWQSAMTRTWFQLPQPVATADADTWLYYDAPDVAAAPPAALDRVFIIGDDFEQPLAWVPNGRTEMVSLDTAFKQGGQASLRVAAGTMQAGGVHRDVALPLEPLLFSHYLRQAQTGASFGHLLTFAQPFASRQLTWGESASISFLELDSGNRLQNVGTSGVTNWYLNFNVGIWRRIEVVHDFPAKQIRARVDSGAWTDPMADRNSGEVRPVKSIALEGEGQGGAFWIDNYSVRRYVAPEPTVLLGPEEALPE